MAPKRQRKQPTGAPLTKKKPRTRTSQNACLVLFDAPAPAKSRPKRTTAAKVRQTGKSKEAYDRKRKAMLPGKRKSASGRVYYERRKNRSDTAAERAKFKRG